MAVSAINTTRNLIFGLCFGLLVGNFAVCFFSVISWVMQAPKTPDVARGLVYAHNEHGSIVYFSAAQTLTDNMFLWLVPLFFVGIIVSPKKNVVKKFFGLAWQNDDPHRVGAITTYVTAAAVIAAAYFAGPQILDFLLAHGFKPIGDS